MAVIAIVIADACMFITPIRTTHSHGRLQRISREQLGPVEALPISEPEYITCKRCDGDGWQDEYNGIVCGHCDGTGEIELMPIPLDYPASIRGR